jgi:hypothetical protein
MKKTVSILSISMFLAASAFAAEPQQITVASAAGVQEQSKAVAVKRIQPAPRIAKASDKQYVDQKLESFGCCGLPQ